jgi:hypothetical protein
MAHIDWKDLPGMFVDALKSSDVQIPATAEINVVDPKGHGSHSKSAHRRLENIKIAMHTDDPYRHMEVQILKGGNKGNKGVVKGSHFSPNGDTVVDVLTSTLAVNTLNTYPIQHLRERL